MTDLAAGTRCRALVAGFGRPGMRDLDFGRQLIRYMEGLDWPEGVVVEDLSYAAPLVLHRLQELEPARVVLLGAVARDLDPPGTLRRYRLERPWPRADEVRRSLEESVQGVIDIDHTLAIVRHWGALPPETVVIEVEPADCSFGPGFSDEMAAAFDPILAMVREELATAGRDTERSDLDALGVLNADDMRPAAAASVGITTPSKKLSELAHYADEHARLRQVQRSNQVELVDRPVAYHGVEVAGRSRPWAVSIGAGSDWFDVIPLEDGWLGIAMGDVVGRGVEAAGAMADLRAAVRAYAVLEGRFPARVVHHLDQLVQTTGVGRKASLVYLALRVATGEVRFVNAEQCPPLIVGKGRPAEFVWDGISAALGAEPLAERLEGRQFLPHDTTLLLFTDGLVQSRKRPMLEGLETLRKAAESSGSLEELCDHLLTVCTHGLRREDDISLLALRLGNATSE